MCPNKSLFDALRKQARAHRELVAKIAAECAKYDGKDDDYSGLFRVGNLRAAIEGRNP
jgi:hypothetical protein